MIESGRLCLIVCGAGPARHATTMVDLAQAEHWSLTVIATPAALSMIDEPAIARRIGGPVRIDYSSAGQPRHRSSSVDALIIAPATYNTINKLALGINDNYALNVAAEAIGRGVPTVILPFINSALASRHPFHTAVTTLRGEGLKVLFGPGEWSPHPPGTGEGRLLEFPWKSALRALAQLR